MFVPLSELVFVPIHTIDRISFFGKEAKVYFKDSIKSEILDGEDAKRLFYFVMSTLPEQFRSSTVDQAARQGH
jgi:hypothetical protein